jgi:hypothetical protein
MIRRAVASALVERTIPASILRIEPSSVSQCFFNSSSEVRASSGIASLGCASCAISSQSPVTPFGATAPNSAIIERSELPSMVR